MTESIEINVRGGVASAEGGGSGSDKVGGLGFIGGRSASLLGRTIGGAMSAAIGATPAIAAILVIADVLKTAMAPALKMISAILKVLGAIFMPVGIIIMMLLRPVLMILLPILKFMWLVWRPHMMKIANAARDMQSGKISKTEFLGIAIGEAVSFFGDLFAAVVAQLGAMISEEFAKVVANVVRSIGGIVTAIFDLSISLVASIKGALLSLAPLLDPLTGGAFSKMIEDVFGSVGSNTGIIGGLEGAKSQVGAFFETLATDIETTGKTAGKVFKDAIMARVMEGLAELERKPPAADYVGPDGKPLGGEPTVGGYPLDVSKILSDLNTASVTASNALNGADSTFTPQVKLAGTTASQTSEKMLALSKDGIAPLTLSFSSLTTQVGLLTNAIVDAVTRITNASRGGSGSSSNNSYEDNLRGQVAARGWYTR